MFVHFCIVFYVIEFSGENLYNNELVAIKFVSFIFLKLQVLAEKPVLWVRDPGGRVKVQDF